MSITENLERLRALERAATLRPWKTGHGYEQSSRGNYIYGGPRGYIVCAEDDDTDCALSTEDRDLIATLRNCAPAALDFIEASVRSHVPASHEEHVALAALDAALSQALGDAPADPPRLERNGADLSRLSGPHDCGNCGRKYMRIRPGDGCPDCTPKETP